MENRMEASEESTLGAIFDEIADLLAEARTRALMGERQEALTWAQAACSQYARFRDVLEHYPGNLALQHSLVVTLNQLCADQTDSLSILGSLNRPHLTSHRKRNKAA